MDKGSGDKADLSHLPIDFVTVTSHSSDDKSPGEGLDGNDLHDKAQAWQHVAL